MNNTRNFESFIAVYIYIYNHYYAFVIIFIEKSKPLAFGKILFLRIRYGNTCS